MIIQIKTVILSSINFFLNFVYSNNLKKYKNQSIYVIDIDNTLTINKLGEKIKFENPLPNFKIIKELKTKINFENSIFLTARNIKLSKITFTWLKKHELIFSKNQLLIVDSPNSKLKFLDQLINQKNEIIYIDDLSYNHENGEVKLYKEVIEKLKVMPVNYLGLEYIKKISDEEDIASN